MHFLKLVEGKVTVNTDLGDLHTLPMMYIDRRKGNTEVIHVLEMMNKSFLYGQ